MKIASSTPQNCGISYFVLEPQKYDEQMMATEYIDNEAKIDNTSARHVTKRNLKKL